jgi:hypothetical protein
MRVLRFAAASNDDVAAAPAVAAVGPAELDELLAPEADRAGAAVAALADRSWHWSRNCIGVQPGSGGDGSNEKGELARFPLPWRRARRIGGADSAAWRLRRRRLDARR